MLHKNFKYVTNQKGELQILFRQKTLYRWVLKTKWIYKERGVEYQQKVMLNCNKIFDCYI